MTILAASPIARAARSRRSLLFLWVIFTLNAVLRLPSANYHAFGYWAGLSLAIGLAWAARTYRRPVLGYLAAGGIAMALFMLVTGHGSAPAAHVVHRAAAAPSASN